PSREARPTIVLSEGYLYQLSHTAVRDDMIQFEQLTYFTDSELALRYRRKAAPTRTLWESEEPWEIAELQWRISRPLATLLLALIAVTFIQTVPRQDKATRTYLLAAVVFAVYYNLSGLAKNWVEQGVVNTTIGVWWLYALMFFALLLYALKPGQKLLSLR
ncbi:MAG: LptF/LptG family permease, partial [Nitrosomonas sp.]|nr:LptF/LptG family permease [Nitrosomonas sp.]